MALIAILVVCHEHHVTRRKSGNVHFVFRGCRRDTFFIEYFPFVAHRLLTVVEDVVAIEVEFHGVLLKIESGIDVLHQVCSVRTVDVDFYDFGCPWRLKVFYFGGMYRRSVCEVAESVVGIDFIVVIAWFGHLVAVVAVEFIKVVVHDDVWLVVHLRPVVTSP